MTALKCEGPQVFTELGDIVWLLHTWPCDPRAHCKGRRTEQGSGSHKVANKNQFCAMREWFLCTEIHQRGVGTITEFSINYWKPNFKEFHVRKMKGGVGGIYSAPSFSPPKPVQQPFNPSAAHLEIGSNVNNKVLVIAISIL